MSAQRRQKDELEDIIGDIKNSHQKTNMIDVDEGKLVSCSASDMIGWLLKGSRNLSDKEFSMNFDPLETVFLQKLVSSNTMNKRVVLRMEDYFKGIVFMDYFSNIVLGDENFIDEMYDISKRLEQINSLIDPDIETVVKYSAIHHLTSMGRSMILRSRSERDAGIDRYARTNYQSDNLHQYVGVRELDSFYSSLGQKVFGLFSNHSVKEQLSGVQGVNDLRALLFIDSALQYIEDTKLKDDVLTRARSGDYYTASVKAITSLSKEATTKSVEDYISSLNEKIMKIDPNKI